MAKQSHRRRLRSRCLCAGPLPMTPVVRTPGEIFELLTADQDSVRNLVVRRPAECRAASETGWPTVEGCLVQTARAAAVQAAKTTSTNCPAPVRACAVPKRRGTEPGTSSRVLQSERLRHTLALAVGLRSVSAWPIRLPGAQTGSWARPMTWLPAGTGTCTAGRQDRDRGDDG